MKNPLEFEEIPHCGELIGALLPYFPPVYELKPLKKG